MRAALECELARYFCVATMLEVPTMTATVTPCRRHSCVSTASALAALAAEARLKDDTRAHERLRQLRVALRVGRRSQRCVARCARCAGAPS